MGHRALDYFGWEFAKEEKNDLKDLMKNQSIVDAVDSNEFDHVVVETKQDKGLNHRS